MAINMRQDKKGTHAGKNIQLSVQKKLHCMKSVYELKFKKNQTILIHALYAQNTFQTRNTTASTGFQSVPYTQIQG